MGTRPRLAVEIRPEGIVAARAESARAPLAAVALSRFAEGAVNPELKAGNVANHATVVEAVREALDAVSAGNSRDVTMVIPDASVRVLLLDFDELASKQAEALPVVRFRLKKLLPFDADEAAVSYQVMTHGKNSLRVLAVAMPRDVLAEYEGVVTAAGYMPGAVLPSTLAALAALEESNGATLVINASRRALTAAIVNKGELLLHRTLETVETVETTPQTPEQKTEAPAETPAEVLSDTSGFAWRDGDVEVAPPPVEKVEPGVDSDEIAQQISIAAAYFEDTLQQTPEAVISAGTLGAEHLASIMSAKGMYGLPVREMVGAEALDVEAATASTPRSWLAGVRGALKG
ncbi:MAG: hypothetical protein FWD64_09825 [Acidobacteriaceae bacterium]|nr:hypothetical protein [Acidobacteriaceae bacterium]